MDIFKILIGCLFLVIAGLISEASLADSNKINPMLGKKYAIWLGGFFPDLETTVRLNGEVIEKNPDLKLENTLNLDDSKSVLWGGANWKISKRNLIEIEFANLNRDGTTIVETDPIEIEDTIARAGAQIDTTFDLLITRLTYGYGLVKTRKADLRLKVGYHQTDIQLGIQMSGNIDVCQPGEIPPDCATSVDESASLETSDITFPLPHLGASFAYAFTPKLALRTQALGFAIEINGIKGSLLELDADIVYHPWPSFGLGAGARYFNANVESDGNRLDAEFDFEYFGPVIYGTFTF